MPARQCYTYGAFIRSGPSSKANGIWPTMWAAMPVGLASTHQAVDSALNVSRLVLAHHQTLSQR